jgi:hypothetical protein
VRLDVLDLPVPPIEPGNVFCNASYCFSELRPPHVLIVATPFALLRRHRPPPNLPGDAPVLLVPFSVSLSLTVFSPSLTASHPPQMVTAGVAPTVPRSRRLPPLVQYIETRPNRKATSPSSAYRATCLRVVLVLDLSSGTAALLVPDLSPMTFDPANLMVSAAPFLPCSSPPSSSLHRHGVVDVPIPPPCLTSPLFLSSVVQKQTAASGAPFYFSFVRGHQQHTSPRQRQHGRWDPSVSG